MHAKWNSQKVAWFYIIYCDIEVVQNGCKSHQIIHHCDVMHIKTGRPKGKPVFYILAPFWFARLSCFQLFCYSPKWELVCTLILSIISGSVIKNFEIFCRYCRASQWNQRIEKRAAVNRGRNRYLFTYSKSSILINLTLTLQPPWIVNWWLWMTWIGIRSGNWRRTSEPNNVKRMKLKTK